MRLSAQQLEGHLARSLAPVYVVSGDEPLQAGECLDRIRRTARAQGFGDRIVLEADARFDWSVLRHFADSLSLFAERRILDIRLPSGKPGDAGARALADYAARPGPDNLLLLSLPRLDRRTLDGRWMKALDAAGAVVQVWPVEPARLPGWIAGRARAAGLAMSPEAAAVLADRIEGNLLACAQEIDKLALLHGAGPVEVEQVLESVADSARFGAFDLVDAALAGNAVRCVRMTRGLREEGVEPLPVLGALAWAIRGMAELARELGKGGSVDQVLGRNRVWSARRGPVTAALKRHPADAWLALLATAGEVDRVCKGAPGAPWDALQALVLAVCGVRIPGQSIYV